MANEVYRRCLTRLLVLGVLSGVLVVYPPGVGEAAWPHCGIERQFFYDAELTQYAGIIYRNPDERASEDICHCESFSDGDVGTDYWFDRETCCPPTIPC
jgi:hypothetical protein